MTATEAIALARSLSLTLSAAGERLHSSGPRGALTPELRQVLTANRAEVVVELCRERVPPVFNTVTKAEELLQLAHAVAEAGIVALDVETTGLDALKDRPRLLQLALPDGSIHIIDLCAIGNIDALGKALGAVTAIGHNMKFDLGFLRRHYGIVVGQVRCTMTAARLIDAGVHRGTQYEGYFSLVEVAARSLGVRLDKTLQTSDWSCPSGQRA